MSPRDGEVDQGGHRTVVEGLGAVGPHVTVTGLDSLAAMGGAPGKVSEGQRRSCKGRSGAIWGDLGRSGGMPHLAAMG